jgi:hypothetical protein
MKTTTYNDIRSAIQTGDVALVEGRRIGSTIIRMATGQQMSHIGVFIWVGDGLWVYEFIGKTGFRAIPASQWVGEYKRDKLYWGKAPALVRAFPAQVRAIAETFRGQKYGYVALIQVWWAQMTKKKIKTQIVCSTFAQKTWEAAKYVFYQTPDPGDFVNHCESITFFTAE